MATRAKLTVKQAAAVAKIQPSTFRAYVARGQAPSPDGHSDPCGCPWWWRSNIDHWVANRKRAA